MQSCVQLLPGHPSPRQMSAEEFSRVCEKLRPFGKDLFFHVMGEPLLHPELDDILRIAGELGFSASITTNGTLIKESIDTLLRHASVLRRVSFSLHAPEGNGKNATSGEYLDGIIGAAKRLSPLGVYSIFRLWNLDSPERKGENTENKNIHAKLLREYPDPWQKRYSGYRLCSRTFLEYDGIFTWPSESNAEPCEAGTCRALTQQIAILADGTVVPCCLDSDGNIPLGNIFSDTMGNIIASRLFTEMKKGFAQGRMVHPMCKKCVYARRFKR